MMYLCSGIPPKRQQKNTTMETKVKRTREEVRAAFKEFMRRKKENEIRAIAEIEHLRRQVFFETALN